MGRSTEHLTSQQAEAFARWLRDGGEDGEGAHDAPTIRGYALGKPIGEGASSRVYLATREGSDRRLAVKIFKHELGPLALAEAERLEQARLACLPEVADFGRTSDGAFFLATAYVDGKHATDWADARELGTRERVDLLVRICRAVGELHERGLIHRDLKPANILVNEHGDVTLVDLGIGWSAAERERAPAGPGQSGGTPTYAAPEQWADAAPTTRMDVHALGATARELLRRLAVPKPLRAVLDKATAPEPNDRYPDARELGDDLERWLRREPVEALPAGRLRRACRWVGRHPVWATAVACAGMVVATIGLTIAGVLLLGMRPHAIQFSSTDGALSVVTRAHVKLDTVFNVDAMDSVRTADPADRHLAMVRKPIGSPPTAGIFDWSDLRQPLCSFDDLKLPRPPAPREVPHHDTPGRLAKGYEIYALVGADVFGDDGVDEILVSIRFGTHSASAVLVVDQTGQVLASLWHDGQIDALGWLASSRTILAAGVNSEVGAHERVGATWDGYDGDPLVVFGVKLDPGVHEWINTSSLTGTLEPEFYQCLSPLEAAGWLQIENIMVDRTGAARVSLVPEKEVTKHQGRSSVSFGIDHRGVGALDSVGDAYPDTLPDPRGFTWTALPLWKPGVQAGGREQEIP